MHLLCNSLEIYNTLTLTNDQKKVVSEICNGFQMLQPEYTTNQKRNKMFQGKIVNIFLSIILTYVLGAQKNRLNSFEHPQHMFGLRIFFCYTLLTMIVHPNQQYIAGPFIINYERYYSGVSMPDLSNLGSCHSGQVRDFY